LILIKILDYEKIRFKKWKLDSKRLQ